MRESVSRFKFLCSKMSIYDKLNFYIEHSQRRSIYIPITDYYRNKLCYYTALFTQTLLFYSTHLVYCRSDDFSQSFHNHTPYSRIIEKSASIDRDIMWLSSQRQRCKWRTIYFEMYKLAIIAYAMEHVRNHAG